jgi:hypothetical protein
LGRKPFFDLSRKRKLLRKVSQFSRNFVNFSQCDEKWYKVSVEKEYMKPDLDPSDSVRILVLFEEKGNSMLNIIKQSKHLLRKVQYKKYIFFRLGAFKSYGYIK